MNVEDVIRVRIAEAARKVKAARQQRTAFNAARQVGLAHRHAQKLRNLARTDLPAEGQLPEVASPQQGATNDGGATPQETAPDAA